MPKLTTERTETILMGAKLPGDSKSFQVPDDHPCIDKAQQALLTNFKNVFGTQEAKSTLKVSIDKKGERRIYEPCVMAKDGKVVIEWGGKFYPVPSNAVFKAGRMMVVVKVGEDEYAIKARVLTIKPEEAAGKVQTAWAKCGKDDKTDYLASAWTKGTIVEILSQGFPTVCKLAEVVGTNSVVGYEMGRFEKYVIKLADGRLVGANTALNTKLAGYEEMGIVVSPESPAQLTVGKSTSKTTTGHDIYPVTLVSHRNIDLPVFDFGSYSDVTEDNVDRSHVDPTDYDFSQEFADNIPF